MELQIWWIWMILSAVFLIAEIVTAGFFLLWFCIGSAVAGVLALLNVGTPAQLTVFILVSGILFVLSRRFADLVTVKQPPGIGADRFVDQKGMVLVTIDNTTNIGKVRIGQDEWAAKSLDDSIIQKGTIIKVIRIDGTRAIVESIKKENSDG